MADTEWDGAAPIEEREWFAAAERRGLTLKEAETLWPGAAQSDDYDEFIDGYMSYKTRTLDGVQSW